MSGRAPISATAAALGGCISPAGRDFVDVGFVPNACAVRG